MRTIRPILVLLLAISLIAASAPLPAAFALSTTVPSSGTLGNNQATSQPGSTVGPHVGGSAQGDPGGAGDGLGADLDSKAVGSQDVPAPAPTVDLLLLLLRLMHVAG